MNCIRVPVLIVFIALLDQLHLLQYLLIHAHSYIVQLLLVLSLLLLELALASLLAFEDLVETATTEGA